MTLLFLVALGGGIGAILRYSMSKWTTVFYRATLLVNLLGSFAMGCALHIAVDEKQWLAFVTTGFLGGFTTFSTFAFDVVRLIEERQLMKAFLYCGITLLGGIIAISLGYYSWQ